MQHSHLDLAHGIVHEPKVSHPDLVQSLASDAVKHIPGGPELVRAHFSEKKTYRDILPKKPQNQLMYEIH